MRIYQSEKGFLCAEVKGRNIHSRYNPYREAERFIENKTTGSPSVVILIGAGLGYIQEVLDKKLPGTPVLSIFLDYEIYNNCYFRSAESHCWFPDSPEAIVHFLHRYIKETELSSLCILEWEPCASLYPREATEFTRILKNIIQELNGNILTTAWFGKKWLRNTIVNYLSIERYSVQPEIDRPVLIASSGPSLSEIIDEIKLYRNRFFLLALPSSLRALMASDILPDLVMTTDPGYYSRVHLNYVNSDARLALPLTAGRGSWNKNASVILLNQMTPYEIDLFEKTGIANLPLNANGTVSGSALELSAKYGQPVYFGGLDLCFKDIQSHVVPHSFDELLSVKSSRKSPLYTIYYERAFNARPDFSTGIRTGRSLITYRNWFNHYSKSSPLPIGRIKPSPVSLDFIKPVEIRDIPESPLNKNKKIQTVSAPSADIKKKQISGLLEVWIREQENGENDPFFYHLDAVKATGNKDRSDAIQYLCRLKDLYG
ncbi:MAG: DUF115 domain-containing protein [Spirochaetales bacterium]|nr:DUF115 domain-containing protein [Spirochaetales bacterium]